jgi:hypothetical protein
MPRFSLPTPCTARPLPSIEPSNAPAGVLDAYVDLLAVIYHAEVAALDAFARLTQPDMVEPCDALLKARPMLMRDEEAHLQDVAQIVRELGKPEVPPEPVAFTQLWSVERARERLLYPLPAHVAAMFILSMESLGYVVLWHLAERTADPAIAARLRGNVKDEQAHLHASMHVLDRTVAERGWRAYLDMALHALAFAVLSRHALGHLRRVLGGLGWDIEIVAASAVQFTGSLFLRALGLRRFVDVPAFVARAVTCRPVLRLLELSAGLPEPTILWPALRRVAARLRRPIAARLSVTP